MNVGSGRGYVFKVCPACGHNMHFGSSIRTWFNTDSTFANVDNEENGGSSKTSYFRECEHCCYCIQGSIGASTKEYMRPYHAKSYANLVWCLKREKIGLLALEKQNWHLDDDSVMG